MICKLQFPNSRILTKYQNAWYDLLRFRNHKRKASFELHEMAEKKKPEERGKGAGRYKAAFLATSTLGH